MAGIFHLLVHKCLTMNKTDFFQGKWHIMKHTFKLLLQIYLFISVQNTLMANKQSLLEQHEEKYINHRKRLSLIL